MVLDARRFGDLLDACQFRKLTGGPAIGSPSWFPIPYSFLSRTWTDPVLLLIDFRRLLRADGGLDGDSDSVYML